ncbi:HlyD family type I secretion periplasmic adaptor subunit [Leptolyngbya ohadii]|uniref:HlyD family type I secretion periplasmic adaptor subunit n=1 Tax=Leptolyngbya ohadii TaxID=1962290 RepID=UPI000B59A8B3|nr:HlyD family type I secretion periplasmic adaptor subunit [Leptolyngbya ohadii]
MPIRIQSLSHNAQNWVAPEAPERLPCDFSTLFTDSVHFSDRLKSPEINCEIDLIYGGVSASLPMTQSAGLPLSEPAAPSSAASGVGNWSTSLQTLLDRPPAALPHQLVWGGVAFCAALAAWSMVGRIDEVGRAQGRLMPQGEPYKVNPILSGKLARIYVQENQMVKAGQVIADLDNEVARDRVEWSTRQRTSLKQELREVEALIHKTRTEAQVRFAIAEAEIRAQGAAIAQAQARIESQSAAIHQAEDQVATGQILLDQLQQNAAAQQERIARFEYLFHEGALAREQLFQAQEQFGDRQRTITQQAGEIQQAMVQSQRLRADLQQAIAEFSRLQAELTRKYAEAQQAQIQTQQTIQQLMVQRTQIQTKIQQNEAQIAEAKAVLKQLTLRAPVDGFVSSLEVRKSGEVVQSGQTIAEIAPQSAPLVLMAVLPAREAGFVKVGDRAQVKFDAYPYQDYGIVAGKVTAVSPDVKVDDRMGAVYRVEITLDRTVVTKDRETVRLRAGQTATADIVIRQRRIAEVLLDPIRKLQESDLTL